MAITYEFVATDPARHPVTGDKKIAQEIGCINPAMFSVGTVDRYVNHIRDLYSERPPEVVAPLAQHLLKAVLQLETVRADAIEKVLAVIQERGLWVEPAESAGGRAPGIEPAESYEEFVERNKIQQQVEARAALATRAEARPLAKNGEIGNGRPAESSFDNRKATQGGTSAEYQLRRLQRDRPDLYELWKAGEYKSVRAACLAAGFAPVALALTKDPFTSAQRIQEQRGQDWINDLVGALSPGALSATQSAGEVRVFLEELHPDRLRYVLSSLCSRHPEVFGQLLDDMAEDEAASEHWQASESPVPDTTAPAPVPVPTPAPASSGNCHNKVNEDDIRPVPEPGFYGPAALRKAADLNPATLSTAINRASDGEEILLRITKDLPVRFIVHKNRSSSERLEVIRR